MTRECMHKRLCASLAALALGVALETPPMPPCAGMYCDTYDRISKSTQ